MDKFILVLIGLLFFNFASAFSVAIPISDPLLPIGFLAGATSGHEEITRQSLFLLNKYFSSVGISIDELSPEILIDKNVNFIGTSGLNTQNSIIRGNYATDLPDGLAEHFNLKKASALMTSTLLLSTIAILANTLQLTTTKVYFLAYFLKSLIYYKVNPLVFVFRNKLVNLTGRSA